MVTVGGVRVRVKVAADRRPCHERWQAPVARGLELARVLPELGWNIREPEDPVHLRSEEHTSELQSLAYLVCRLLLEKKKKITSRQVILKNKKIKNKTMHKC